MRNILNTQLKYIVTYSVVIILAIASCAVAFVAADDSEIGYVGDSSLTGEPAADTNDGSDEVSAPDEETQTGDQPGDEKNTGEVSSPDDETQTEIPTTVTDDKDLTEPLPEEETVEEPEEIIEVVDDVMQIEINPLDELLFLVPLGVVSVNDRAELETAISAAILAGVSDLTIVLSASYTDTSAPLIFDTAFPITIDGAAVNLGTTSLPITQNGTGAVTLKNLSFAGGTASALSLNGSNAPFVLDNCSFTGLTATALITGANVTADITNCTFDGNHANPGAIAPGSGSGSKLTITTSSFIGNWNSTMGGGAISMTYASGELTIDRCYFYRNYADGPADSTMQGGAIRFTNCALNVVIKDSLFVENKRDAYSSTNCDGGAIAFRNNGGVGTASISITGTTFDGNSAGDDGGAMLLESNLGATNLLAYIANCTFTNNYAGGTYMGNEGGGIAFYGMVNSEITHCTFYGNSCMGGYNSSLVILGGGGVALDSGPGANSPMAPVLSNNIFIANTCAGSATRGNVFILPNADGGASRNNGNVGYDNNTAGYSGGQNISANITVENAFAETTGTGTTAVPLRIYFGAPVGAPGNTGHRFCYIPSPLTDEMYRDGSGPYYDAAVRSDVRGYPRDHFPNAGAVEIYWTKFDPGIADGGEWIPADVPTDAIRSLLEPERFYLVTNPPPGNVNALLSFPRTSINNTDNTLYSFRGWESNQPSNPTAAPGSFVYPSIAPSTTFTSTKQTYTAAWLYNPSQFRVDFNLQYSVGAVPQYGVTQFVNSGQYAVKPADPVRSGYVLDGWFKDPACTTAWNFATETITRDTTIYAKWAVRIPVQTFTVRFVDWDGTLLKSQVVNGGDSATPPANPSRSGYYFTGWNGFYAAVWIDTTVTAQYSLNDVTPTPTPTPTIPTIPIIPAIPTIPIPGLPVVNSPDSPEAEPAPTSPPAGPGESAPAENQDEDPDNTGISGRGVPLGGFTTSDAWSLLSLLLAIVGLLFAIVKFVVFLMQRRSGSHTEYSSRKRLIAIIAIPANLLALILFLILENLTLPMVWLNIYTPIVFLGFIIGVVMLILSRGRQSQKESDDFIDWENF